MKKIHDTELLLTEVGNYDEFFNNYLDIGRKLTAFYFEDRYPSGPIFSYSEEEVKEILDNVEKLINKIENLLKNL